jgi:hypothetical protein
MKTFQEVLGDAQRLEDFTRLWFKNNPPVYIKSGRIYHSDSRGDFLALMRTDASKVNLDNIDARAVFGFEICKGCFSWGYSQHIKKEIEQLLPKVDLKDQWAKDIEEWYKEFRDDVPSYEWTHTVADKNRAYRITVSYGASTAIDALKKLHSRTPTGCSMKVKLEHNVYW